MRTASEQDRAEEEEEEEKQKIFPPEAHWDRVPPPPLTAKATASASASASATASGEGYRLRLRLRLRPCSWSPFLFCRLSALWGCYRSRASSPSSVGLALGLAGHCGGKR